MKSGDPSLGRLCQTEGEISHWLGHVHPGATLWHLTECLCVYVPLTTHVFCVFVWHVVHRNPLHVLRLCLP